MDSGGNAIGTVFRRALPSGECCIPGEYEIEAPGAIPMVASGGTYSLHVRTPSGEEVSGTTTIPASGAFSVPAVTVFFRLRDTLRLSWPRVPGARSYEVVIQSERSGAVYRTFTDTAVAIAGTALTIAGDEVFYAGDDVAVMVSAVDANYYDYYRAQSDPFAGVAPSHLIGAVGVFGSLVPILGAQLRVR
jgi:hypothetical protein